MTRMRVREVSNCAKHGRALVVLEDASRRRTLTFYADPHEVGRLVQELRHGPGACHPVYDFIDGLLRALQTMPTHVELEDVEGQGIGAAVCASHDGSRLRIPCYPPDALALAHRKSLPIYATAQALDHAEPVQPPPTEQGESGDDILRWLDRLRPGDFSTPADREP